MTVAVSADAVERLLNETPFARLYGFHLRSLADGECVLDIPYRAEFDRPDGLISGPVFMCAADIGVWFAIMTRLGEADGAAAVTVEMQTAFLRGGSREDVQCRARVLKWGKRLIYATAECVSAHCELLTHHTLTYIRPERHSKRGERGGAEV